MKKSLLLLFLLAYSFTFSQHLVKPDTLWTYGPAKFTSYPAVHPNGNVLIRIGFDVHELYGLTGELIRKINIPVGTSVTGRIDVSTDGTKLLAGGYFIDYDSGELIRTLPNNYRYCFLHPFNDVIMFIQPWGTEPISDSTLRRYNLSTSEEIPIRTDFPVTSLEVSNDGKYLAIGCLELEPEDRTHFYLYDAQTLKLIDELENVPSEGRQIEFIQFSETAKYVGYGHVSSGTSKATIFTVQTPNKKWEFSNWKMPGYGMNGLGLLDDKYTFLSNDEFSIIWDIDQEKIIYQTSIYGTYFPIYNKYNHTIIVGTVGQKKAALDLDAILYGVDVKDDINADNLTITYMNGYLLISDIEPTSTPIDMKLFDINGKILYQSLQPIIEDSLQIKIDMQSGVYILQMQEGDRQYSQKFIISN